MRETPPNRVGILPLVLGLVPLLGCVGERAAGAGPAVRDSAGIRIVTSSSPTWSDAEAWRLSASPTLEIGAFSDDPNYELYNATSALRLDDGRIVIGNSGSHEIRYYGPDGVFLFSTGSQGGGPGEFEQLAGVARYGADSLIAYDFRHRRLSIFDMDGNFGRSANVVPAEGMAFPIAAGPFSDGSFLMTGLNLMGGPRTPGLTRRDDPVYRYSRAGELADSLGAFPGMEMVVRSDERGVWLGALLFGKSTDLTVAGTQFYAGTNDTYEIKRYSQAGDLTMIIRKDLPLVEITQQDVAEAIASRVEGFSDDQSRADQVSRLESMPTPATFPAFSVLTTDRGGNLWVRDFAEPGDERRVWSVFDPEGVWLGTVEMPEGTRLLTIGDEHVLVRWTDDLDVEYVRLYELIKPE